MNELFKYFTLIILITGCTIKEQTKLPNVILEHRPGHINRGVQQQIKFYNINNHNDSVNLTLVTIYNEDSNTNESAYYDKLNDSITIGNYYLSVIDPVITIDTNNSVSSFLEAHILSYDNFCSRQAFKKYNPSEIVDTLIFRKLNSSNYCKYIRRKYNNIMIGGEICFDSYKIDIIPKAGGSKLTIENLYVKPKSGLTVGVMNLKYGHIVQKIRVKDINNNEIEINYLLDYF